MNISLKTCICCLILIVMSSAHFLCGVQTYLDVSFGEERTGIVMTALSCSGGEAAAALQPDGKILVAGIDADGTDFMIMRYNADGSVDTDFNGGTAQSTEVGTYTHGICLALQNDGSSIVAGSTLHNGSMNFVACRHTSAGALDTTYGLGTGKAYTAIGSGASLRSVIVDGSNRVVASGSAIIGGFGYFATVRYATEGVIDNTFGDNGIVMTLFTNAIQSSGRWVKMQGANILVGGCVKNSSTMATDLALAQYTSTGAPDSSFGTEGQSMIAISNGKNLDITVMGFQASGKIIVGGTVNNKFMVARLFADTGFLDLAFNATGVAITGFDKSAHVHALAISNDKIIAVGGSGSKIALARYGIDGALDITFGLQGKIVTDIGLASEARFVAVQGDGKILVVGSSDGQIFIARYLAGGSAQINWVEQGNIAFVDQVFGDDQAASINGRPFKTITAARNAASSLATPETPVQICVQPGTYDEVISIPDNIVVRGQSAQSVKIRKQDVTTDIDLVTMGNNSRLEDIRLELTSSEHHTLRGIVFPGVTTETARLSRVLISIDNHLASAEVGSSDVQGVYLPNTATGRPASDVSNIQGCSIKINSNGNGAKRGVLIDGASTLNLADTNVAFIDPNGGSGSYIGAETANTNAQLALLTSTLKGPVSGSSGAMADISQTLGKIALTASQLVNYRANGKSFTSTISPTKTIVWACSGDLSNGFMKQGTAQVTDKESSMRVQEPFLVKSMTVRALTAPGQGYSTTWTLRITGHDVPGFTMTLNNDETSKTYKTQSVFFNTGDDIALKVNKVGGQQNKTADVVVMVELY